MAGSHVLTYNQILNVAYIKILEEKGYKGCTVFECFGAGQKISQVTFNGIDWRKDAKHARKMYDAFPIMHQLHEILWYLNEAILLTATQPIHKELSKAIEETDRLSNLNADELMKVNIPLHRAEVNVLLLETSELVWKEMNAARKETNESPRSRSYGSKFEEERFARSEFKRSVFNCG